MDLPHNFTFNLEGYWKTMDNLNEYCGIDGIYPDLEHWETETLQGKGRSYGVETELRWRSDKMDVSAIDWMYANGSLAKLSLPFAFCNAAL